MRAFILASLAISATAAAAPGFEVIDHGDTVEIVAHDMTAGKLVVLPVRSRLEVPLVGPASANREFPADKTIHQIELDPDDKRLSVKLNFEHADVVALAPFAKVAQVGTDVHLTIPRTPAPVAAVEPPKAETKPEVKTDAKPVETPKPAAPAPATTESAKPAEPVKAQEPAKLPEPMPAKPVAVEKKSAPVATAPETDTRLPTLIALGLAAIGCGVWLVRRKRAPAAAGSSIEILATKSLGAKAKIIWLSAGPREMIVAVTPQQIRVLGQWKPGQADAPATWKAAQAEAFAESPRTTESPRAEVSRVTALPRAEISRVSELPRAPASKPATSAVSGLLKLRANTQLPPINEDVATDDAEADMVWAREILAATGARR